MHLRSLAVAGLATLAVVPGAHAATFGAPLDILPANSDATYSCGRQVPGRPDSPLGSPSCMWSYFQLGSATNTLIAPRSGSVSRIRVKVGATTGPMRVNVIRFLYRQTGTPGRATSAGPFLQAYGPRFTPAAGAVTPVATDLAMRVDPTPPAGDTRTIQAIDALALEVLSPKVPIPLFGSPNSLSYPIYPGPTTAGTPAPSPNALPTYTATSGIGVLMNADIGPPRTSGTAPALGLGGRTARVRRSVASLPVRCAGADCAGRLWLLRPAGAAATRRAVSYGSKRFRIKAGRKTTVKVKLNKAGRKLLKRRRKARVTVRISFARGAGRTRTVRVTLKR